MEGLGRATRDARRSPHRTGRHKHGPSCSGFVCDNAKLRGFIASKSTPEAARNYGQQIREVREASLDTKGGTVLKREELATSSDRTTTLVSNTVVAVLVIGIIAVLVLVVRRRRKKMEA